MYRKIIQKKRGKLELCGCSGRDVFTILSELLERYTNADNSIFTIRNTAESRNRIPQNVYSIEFPVLAFRKAGWI